MPHVRTARVEEREALEELQRRSSLFWEDYREALLAHPEVIALDPAELAAGRARVVEEEGVVAGFSLVLPAGPCVQELDGLFVDPPWMRRGLGRLLIEDLCEQALAAGVLVIEVTANPRALAFYQEVGFETIGEAQTQFGPGIRMRRVVARF